MSGKTSLAQTNLKDSTQANRTQIRKNGKPYTKYTIEDKQRGALAYVLEGTFLGADKASGINHDTLIAWSKTEWWKKAIEDYRERLEDEYRANGHKIIKKAQQAIIDRLENGDVYIDKRGNEKRKPVSMREATFAYGVTYDKQRISLEKPTQVIQNQPDPQQAAIVQEKVDWLKELADGFIQATRYIEQKTIPSEDPKRPETSQSSHAEEASYKVIEANGGHGPVDVPNGNGLPETDGNKA